MTVAAETVLTPDSPLAEVYNQYPFEIDRAEGVYVYDTAGKQYIDFYGGHCVTPIGHGPAEVIDAVTAQARRCMFYSNLARIPIRVDGAAKLLAFNNSGHQRAFFCNSGAEANENALKIALKLTGRSTIAGFDGAFHGRTGIAMGGTDHADWHKIYEAWQGPTTRLTPNDLSGLQKLTTDVAAVILEPIQSIGKCTVFEFDFLKALRKRCDEVGALLIFDEVQTGMGRTGHPAVSNSCGTVPDMMTMAKGIASGFPMGAVLMTETVAAQLEKGDIAATFGGGPMAIAAMCATIDVIEKQGLVAHAAEMERYIRETMTLPAIKSVRGRGLLLGLKLDRPAKPIQQALFKEGIVTGTNADPEQVHLLPALTIQKEHVDALHAALERVL